MNLLQYTEFWLAGFLGVANGVAIVPVGSFIWQVAQADSHSAAFALAEALVLAVLMLLAISCTGWELLLLTTRRSEPAAYETIPVVVFCVGVGALLLAMALLTS